MTERQTSDAGVSAELRADEERLWRDVHDLIDSLPRELVDRPGYFDEGWSAKDLVGHLGSWLAEAGVVLERIRFGTYRRDELHIDEMNARFYAALRNTAFEDVRAQAFTSRNRMLRAWGALDEPSADATFWIAKAGPEHYAEHLPRLREWVREVAG